MTMMTLSRLDDFCRDAGLNLRQTPVLLAVSGGADSMAMAHLFYEHGQRLGVSPSMIRALVIDHGLRPESAEEAAVTVRRLEAMGIPSRAERLTAPAPQTGIQAWARQERYKALWRDAIKDHATIITAHHADDQAETVLMRLARGSGLKGLGGIPKDSQFYGVRILRPFLDCPGHVLRDYLSRQKITPIDDPSNHNRKFERVRWRQDQSLLEESGFSRENLLRLSKASQDIHRHLTAHLTPLNGVGFALLSSGLSSGMGWIDRDVLTGLPKLLQDHVLKVMMKGLGGGQHLPPSEAMDRLLAWVKAPDSARRTLGGLEFTPKQQKIWIYPEAERPWPECDLTAGDHVIDGRWHLRLSHPARVMPLGHQGFAALKRHPKVARLGLQAPARAYWRWPKLQIATNSTVFKGDDGLIALEDGGIIPHLCKVTRDQSPSCWAEMRFIGGDGLVSADELTPCDKAVG